MNTQTETIATLNYPRTLQDVLALAAPQMLQVDKLIRTRLTSDVVLINQIGEHIIASGGKRLRPITVILSALATGYQGQQHIQTAAIIEFIHTATLLHDDVVDESDLRRGHQSANALWGNTASILCGDFLYSRSFQMMVEIEQMRVMQVLADTTNAIAEGEVLQLLHLNNPDTTEASYIEVIQRKTAVLFSAATRLGAILAGLPTEQEQKLADYGMHLGMAFQIADDLLDYTADAATMGKNVGDDLAEGKPTLPLIYAISKTDAAQKQMLRACIENGGLENLPAVVESIRESGAIEYSRKLAEQYADQALNAIKWLPDTAYKSSLQILARYAIGRDH